ncbi:3-beta-hydroxysteroid dehydrogenase [Verticillium alfalfae VaMs.102]|uniref:3-beta-hydroxysteroid dehydrogenase n=1 Tax=Verticillium alfalfae (strain VaMs.102 / ATCC MYA-4576 / FGSC 10136) TaxID=526221 RepID=C9SAE3_VERA1|nr:3-beta-hydroxysteroid dehydrogenase [Verticillium alfalfae VaMs.102]EEY16311.1 3-beta-hydroxysteroid dehydrogenase [Verticillium alfalfae VaMs.102]
MPSVPNSTDSHGRVAIITGGASGMGLAVTQRLSAQGWVVAILDFNEKAGQEAASSIPNTVFLQTDVSSWASLSKAFDDTFERFGTIHFVFANAGIVEHANFYAVHDTTKSRIPPEPDQRVVDINLKSVINTTYLAQHYFRLSPHGGSDGVLVMTGSTGSLYPAEFCAMYAAAKAGVLNLMRSVAVSFYQVDGIRTYTICPGTVRTNLLSAERWGAFPAAYFTAVETVAARVCMLVTGGAMTDSSGRTIPAGEDYGLACEIAGDEFYWRDPVSYCNEATARMMEATSMRVQLASMNATAE